MFLLPSAADFKEWQIWHYQQRLKAIQTPAGIKFIASNLSNLLKTKPCAK